MANTWKISDELEAKIRAKYKKCVFDRVKLKAYPHTKGTPRDKATFEHLDNNEKNISEKNIVMCCGSCNSSKGEKTLSAWFKTDYCKKRRINKNTVAPVVQRFIKK